MNIEGTLCSLRLLDCSSGSSGRGLLSYAQGVKWSGLESRSARVVVGCGGRSSHSSRYGWHSVDSAGHDTMAPRPGEWCTAAVSIAT
ncbi:hypothetical protein KIN20_028260 [Parelaphostrongylus tenuis]|uniref:Uncharacterized protein n=1 Tax=Parelaphostrongylus tenuis TaxID=148309 RepID=A0AAD5R0H3_PARTN|nr:hypothetical protein KIN20_028260 [Parelaphostrongylus tenuis]